MLIMLCSVSTHSHADCIVLLHGLARTSNAMKHIVPPFEAADHQVVNVDYPSRKKTVEELAPLAVEKLGYSNCNANDTVHFITHSMGGILVRYYLENNEINNLGRVVMLAPPNQGSQVVDKLKNVPGYKLLNGPAGMQLGTDANSIPMQMGPVEFDLGVIAGSRTFNVLLSQFLPNPDDGKVSVENTKVEGMKAFITLPVTHTFMMKSKTVIDQAVNFIKTGKFLPL